jgi:hypothetical protein
MDVQAIITAEHDPQPYHPFTSIQECQEVMTKTALTGYKFVTHGGQHGEKTMRFLADLYKNPDAMSDDTTARLVFKTLYKDDRDAVGEAMSGKKRIERKMKLALRLRKKLEKKKSK